MSKVSLSNITKDYGKTRALTDFSFTSKENEFVVVVGPSGCGKSTLLNIVAGLEKPTRGSIYIDGEDITKLQPNERNISIVFQNYALYPNMTVYENVAFPLLVRRYDKTEIKQLVEQVAEKLEITEYLYRKPKTLSGGQRQRVAIGRAMIRKPHVFLLDEPLSNLDASLREKTREELIRLHNSIEAVFLYVTHDQVEALSMAERIIVLKEGVIQQVGTPKEIYYSPENLFVARFIGSPRINILSAETFNTFFEPVNFYRIDSTCVGIRPENIVLIPDDCERAGVITLVEMLGKEFAVHVQIGNHSLIASIPAHLFNADLQCGKRVKCAVDESKVIMFDSDSGKRIHK